ncbi:MAG: hypothetical protein AAGB93_25220, partial [Planctomycetota bacterium]
MSLPRLLSVVAVAALLLGGAWFRQSSDRVPDGDPDVVERVSLAHEGESASVGEVVLVPAGGAVGPSSAAPDEEEAESAGEVAERPEHEAVLRLVAGRLGDALGPLPAETRAAGSRRLGRRVVQVVAADPDTVEIRVDVPLLEELS